MATVRPAGAPQPDDRWLRARRVLVSRLDNLGDVLLATPAIHALRAALPAAELVLHASPTGAQVGALVPDLDAALAYSAPWMDPERALPQDPGRELAEVERLREAGFDGAVIFTSYHESPLPAAYLYYLAGIPLRHAASVDGPGSLLTSRHRHPERPLHEVERGLDLVAGLGLPTPDPSSVRLPLRLRPGEREAAAARLRAAGCRRPGQPLAVVHPGSTCPARTYPAEQFAAAADLLVERLGCAVVLTGSAAEAPLVEGVRRAMRRPSLGLAGATTLPELAGLLALADLVVTNNTGPMHLAAAVQTPVVALFALTNPPEQWRPWQVPHRLLYHPVPCALCYARRCPVDHACLARVSPEQVVAAAAELLSDGLGRRHPEQPQ